MSRRLGETLVKAGSISETELHRALTAQLVFGGHLGTSLLELGYIDEETLGETLSSMFGVPYAGFDELSKVPYSVVRCLPAKLVEKHKVVPLRLEGKSLHLAMIDPQNLLALDEISFVTGYGLVPHVSPEVRILQVLEKYYNLPRTQRYTTLARDLSRLPSRREKLRPLENEEAFLDAESKPQRATAGAAAATAEKGAHATPRSPSAPEAAAAAGKETVVDHWEKYGYGRSWREVAEAIDQDSSGPDLGSDEVDTRPKPPAAPPGAPGALPSLMETSRRLAEAESVEEIVSLTLSYAAARLARSALFVVKGGTAIGWAGVGRDLSEKKVKSLAIPVGAGGDSIFSLIGEGKGWFLGPPPATGGVSDFYAHLGVSPPRAALVVPLAVKGRVTGYLYADGSDEEMLALDLPSMLAACARAGFALQIIILRNKILAS